MGNLSEHLTVTGLALQCLDDWFGNSDEVDLSDYPFGNYQPTTLLSRTMMSYVFLARRNDGLLEQEVVLKILPKELLLEWQSGFMREWNILAKLNHRNIAKIYDAGFNEQGYPYMAMEYVDGLAITDYCNKHRLDVRSRVNLIIQVLDALSHAHNNRIVHLDVKPSNILVTPDGSVKLLDFGIAQLVSQAESSDQDDKRCVFTPSYASPEQLLGDGGVIATDVWQIGLVLYELLVGKNPFKGALIDGQRQHDCPTLLSTFEHFNQTRALRLAAKRSMSKRQLKRALKGDIRHVLACCLNPDGALRYPSVDLVKEELKRALAGFPIRAVATTPVYVLRRFIGRNRYTLAAIAALLLLASGFGFVRVQEKARYVKNIEAQKARAESIAQFSQKLFGDLSPERLLGEKLAAKEILDAGLERLDRESVSLGTDNYMLYVTLARYYRLLGDYKKAKGVLQRISQQRHLASIDPVEDSYLLSELAFIELHLGKLDLSYQYLTTAIANLKAAEQLHSPQGAENYIWLGRLLHLRSKYDESLIASEQAMTIYRALGSQYATRLAPIKNNMALTYKALGDFTRAERLYREALALKKAHLAEFNPSIASTQNNLARLLIDKGALDEALQLLNEAYRIDSKALGEEHQSLSYALKNIAHVHKLKGEYEQAQQRYEKALALRIKHFDPMHPSVASTHISLADLLVKKAALPEADKHLNQAQSILDTKGDKDNIIYFYLYRSQGNILYQQGHITKAQAKYQQAIDIWQEKSPENKLMSASIMTLSAQCLIAQGQYQPAEQMLLSNYTHLQQRLPYGKALYEKLLETLVELYNKSGDAAKGLDYQGQLTELRQPQGKSL